ncbi:MAG TPA: ribonuclease P protein component [Terriglobales bacterium]|nr:ribonuclease P protein component [Terriglobales bacterium]
MSIPREFRLRKHAEFELVYRCGRRHFSHVLTAFYLLRANDLGSAGPRIGITAGKALGKATVRNRIKRRVRAAITENLTRLTRPVDVVVNPKKVALTVEYAEISSEIARAFDSIQQKAVLPDERQNQNAGNHNSEKPRIAIRNP